MINFVICTRWFVLISRKATFFIKLLLEIWKYFLNFQKSAKSGQDKSAILTAILLSNFMNYVYEEGKDWQKTKKAQFKKLVKPLPGYTTSLGPRCINQYLNRNQLNIFY